LYLFLYAAIYGICTGLCYSLLYIVGASSAGLDFVSIYYATKKQKNLGGILVIINSSAMLLGTIIGTYIPAGLVDSQC